MNRLSMKNRFGRLALLFRAFASVFLVRREKNVVPERIAIVQLAKLGDMVCTTPMFAAIKNVYPKSKLLVIGDKTNQDLLRDHPHVDEYLVWDKEDINKVVKEIKEFNPNFACVTGPNFEGLAALVLSGVNAIAAPYVMNGWSPYETKPYNILNRLVISKPHRMGSYAPREYLRLLEPIGINTEDTKKALAHSRMAEEKIRSILSACNIKDDDLVVGMSLSAGNKIKEWPEERFAEVAQKLQDKYGAKIVVIGGPNDKKKIDAECLDLSGKLSIDELKALVSRLSLLIGVDTGPIYIAEAYGVPTVDIVGPMDENEQPPRGDIHRVVVPQDRIKPELHIMNARAYDRDKAIEQVLSITVEEVLKAVDDLLINRARK